MWTTPSGTEKPSSRTYVQQMSERPEDFRVLERVPLDPADIPIRLAEPQDTDTTVVILDTETTGFERSDSIIELGMARCRYGRDGKLSGVEQVLDMLEDPKRPIAPEITRLTGITDDMVRGKGIDWEQVRQMLRGEPVVVAHNAEFDRPFFERSCPNDLRWACTMVDVPWRELGHASTKLEVLLAQEGWFYDAHRAHIDCLATAWLLHAVPGSFAALMEPPVKVIARGSPYEVKDVLKRRGYRWDPKQKQWWTMRKANSGELEYLKGLYPAGYRSVEVPVDRRSAFK